MTPAQFLGRLKRGDLPAVCLFLGSEAYEKQRCREALIHAHAGAEITQYDASETGLTEIVDDARAMSLFASKRLVLVTSAEAVLPRSTRASAEDDGDEDTPGAVVTNGALASYVKSPTPDVVLLFESTRFDLEGEDKKKSDRVRKFYSAIPDVVEFKRMNPDEARVELQAIARRLKLQMDNRAMAMLVEAVAADMTRIATEMEKLSLYAGENGTVTAEDILVLIPDARQSTIFALVNALGRGERAKALASLDVLCRENEYLPLALSFLSSQFRQALAAQRANLRTASQVQGYFTKNGVPMWGGRAEQVSQTAQKFSRQQLEHGLKLIFETDRDLRSARPDDRIVMEDFVIRLTA